MNRVVLCCLVLSAAGVVNAASEPTGTASCSRKMPGACAIEWNFPGGSPRSSYYVQRFDASDQSWHRIFGPVSTPSGTMSEAASEGEIYAAIVCVDPEDGQSCVSSTVVWAPLHPASIDEMPPMLKRKNGVMMAVSKESSYEGQRQEYNMYRLIQWLENVDDPSRLPAMTVAYDIKEPKDAPPEWLYDDLIQYPAYLTYESFRQGNPP